jgi:glycosyltransferase involved in cell wall biosynthesis
MRVLHVINRYSSAGAETSLRELIGATQGRVIDHAVAVLDPAGNRFDDLHALDVPQHVPASRRGAVDGIGHVRRAIAAVRPDLVHTTLFDANTAGRIAARIARVPVLTSLVNTPYVPAALTDRGVSARKHRVVRGVDRLLSRHATTHFHAITEAVAAEYQRDFGLPAERITVVPRGRSRERLGLPEPERRRRVRSTLGLPESTPVLLAVGRQEAQKGHRYLIQAVAHMVEAVPDLRVLLAGRPGAASGPLAEELDRSAAASHVTLLGFRDDVPDLLAAADAFVFPSLYEGLGGAVLEAMAMDLPIVASDVPAVREVLDDGACGLLVPPAVPDALARACIRVLTEAPLAADLAARGRGRFEQTYSAESATAGMVALYRSLAER